uniref:General secretion pathway protein K n=1 Tax=uncultured organism TaxID=155900 RepID=M1Q315_9ZZZZ|nr:general secretion pathway protein K [uncultured organism]
MSEFNRQPESSSEKGSVLILILLIISVLTVSVMESMHLMQVDRLSSRIFQSSFRTQSMAKSGTAVAKFLLFQDKKKDGEKDKGADHLGEAWGQFPKHREIATPTLDTGEFNGTIRDEQGKFPINYLIDQDGEYRKSYKQILLRLLQRKPFALQETEARKIVQAIKDWIDKDNAPTGEFGAEKNYYMSRKNKGTCKNAPITALSELRLIKYISRELYQGKKEKPGLKDLLTVHSNGKININTAGKHLLAAMVKSTVNKETARKFAKNMLEYRKQKTHYDFLSESDWYRNRMAGYNDIQLPSKIVTTKSDYFALRINGSIGEYSSSRYTVLKREKDDKKIGFKTLITEVR